VFYNTKARLEFKAGTGSLQYTQLTY